MIIKTPKVSEVKLGRHYAFMYEHFVLLTQQDAYLFLEKNDDAVLALHFDSPYCKYSGPNDEAHGSHPLAQYGLDFYGLFEVENSPWIEEMRVANRIHPRHSDSLFSGYRHYIACFKDIKFESVCHNMKEVVLAKGDVAALVTEELRKLES
ncbi:MAG: hypothetical protein ACRDD3_04960 [Azovibrio sp.]